MLNEIDRSTALGSPWRVEEAYAAEVELERSRWKAMAAFVNLLTADERLAPGYYRDPDWSVKDLIAHLGAWMAEARVQLLDIAAHAYVPREVDVDVRNAVTLAASRAESWDEVWARTDSARAWMLEAGSHCGSRMRPPISGSARRAPNTMASTSAVFGTGLGSSSISGTARRWTNGKASV